MNKRLVLFTLCLSIGCGGISWGAGELQVPAAAPATAKERAIMEAYRLKAERVQAFRKGRITQVQRDAAAERSKLAREKPGKPGKKSSQSQAVPGSENQGGDK